MASQLRPLWIHHDSVAAASPSVRFHSQVMANNDGGSSEYSEQMQFSTQLDISQLPAPEHVQFEQEARQVDFHVLPSDIEVVGALEVRSVGSRRRQGNAGSVEVTDVLHHLVVLMNIKSGFATRQSRFFYHVLS